MDMWHDKYLNQERQADHACLFVLKEMVISGSEKKRRLLKGYKMRSAPTLEEHRGYYEKIYQYV